MQAQKKIAIFDSGAGGLSVLREILALRRFNEFVYIADNDAFPYGELADNTLVARVSNLIEKSHQRHQFQAVVIACNTASTLALSNLRERFDIPFVGVVPAIKPAAKLTKSTHIAVLATPATIARPYTQKLVEDFAPHCHVTFCGSTLLVKLAEDHITTGRCDRRQIAEEINKLIISDTAMDVIVLACTHFPLIKAMIEAHLQAIGRSDITVIDSGSAIAKRLASLLNTDTPPTDAGQQTNEKTITQVNICYYLSQCDSARETTRHHFDRYLKLPAQTIYSHIMEL